MRGIAAAHRDDDAAGLTASRVKRRTKRTKTSLCLVVTVS